LLHGYQTPELCWGYFDEIDGCYFRPILNRRSRRLTEEGQFIDEKYDVIRPLIGLQTRRRLSGELLSSQNPKGLQDDRHAAFNSILIWADV
jgi:hypothetical protein